MRCIIIIEFSLYLLYNGNGVLINELSEALANEYFVENAHSFIKALKGNKSGSTAHCIKDFTYLFKLLNDMIELNWDLIAPVSKVKIGDKEMPVTHAQFKILAQHIFNYHDGFSVATYNGEISTEIASILRVNPTHTKIAAQQGPFQYGDLGTLELISPLGFIFRPPHTY